MPSIPLETLRGKYSALPSLEELPGERTMRSRCYTWDAFLANGQDVADLLREFPEDAKDHPELAALCLEAWPG